MELKTILESLIFASDKPLTLKQLKALTGNTKVELVKRALDDIAAEFQTSGVQLMEVGGGYQFRTHPGAAAWVKRLLAGRPPRLTQAMLETLAIIAYRQPITRPEIEDIRGVDCGGVIRLLLERSLCRILGKKEEPGRPILYGTTRQFLEFFNLKDLSALPTLKEFTELSEEMAGELESFDGGEPPEAEAEPVPGDTADAASETPAAPIEPAIAAEAAPVEEPAIAAEAALTDEAEIGEAALTDESEIGEAAAPVETVELEGPAQPEPTTAAQTWSRAAAGPGVALDPEEQEDAALLALDRAMERVQGVLRTHQQAERERLQALLEIAGSTEGVAPASGEPTAALPEPGELSGEELPDPEELDRPPEEL